jgi:hypothetical protein
MPASGHLAPTYSKGPPLLEAFPEQKTAIHVGQTRWTSLYLCRHITSLSARPETTEEWDASDWVIVSN